MKNVELTVWGVLHGQWWVKKERELDTKDALD